ncbi:unnamed protein product [Caenorhabditis bovis]|uniref:KANSL3 helical domain-containing protein n=1 Tax=Caenorhabditis bovis TaxID=2654633 RepID=A0A8S1EB72_9PELO|nr:unnamed protein product [Caenorhabditis bovis]
MDVLDVSLDLTSPASLGSSSRNKQRLRKMAKSHPDNQSQRKSNVAATPNRKSIPKKESEKTPEIPNNSVTTPVSVESEPGKRSSRAKALRRYSPDFFTPPPKKKFLRDEKVLTNVKCVEIRETIGKIRAIEKSFEEYVLRPEITKDLKARTDKIQNTLDELEKKTNKTPSKPIKAVIKKSGSPKKDSQASTSISRSIRNRAPSSRFPNSEEEKKSDAEIGHSHSDGPSSSANPESGQKSSSVEENTNPARSPKSDDKVPEESEPKHTKVEKAIEKMAKNRKSVGEKKSDNMEVVKAGKRLSIKKTAALASNDTQENENLGSESSVAKKIPSKRKSVAFEEPLIQEDPSPSAQVTNETENETETTTKPDARQTRRSKSNKIEVEKKTEAVENEKARKAVRPRSSIEKKSTASSILNTAFAIKQKLEQEETRIKNRRSLPKKDGKSETNEVAKQKEIVEKEQREPESTSTTEIIEEKNVTLNDSVEVAEEAFLSSTAQTAETTTSSNASTESKKEADAISDPTVKIENKDSTEANKTRISGGSEEQRYSVPAPNEEPKLSAKTPPKSRPSINIRIEPVRSSTRAHKPNRLYSGNFDVDPSIGRVLGSIKGKSVDVPVTGGETSEKPHTKVKIEVNVKDITPVREKKKPPENPLRHGVLRNYVPSIKPYIPNFERDGKVVNCAQIVNCVMDAILYEVCGDGVKKHSDIMTPRQKKQHTAMCAARRSEIHRKAMAESRTQRDDKLRVRIEIDTPEEKGRRSRQAPKKDADYMYIPIKRSKESSADPEYEAEISDQGTEREQQLAREFLSKVNTDEIMKAIQSEKTRVHTESKKKKKMTIESYMNKKHIMNRPECGIRLYDKSKKAVHNHRPSEYFYAEFATDYKPVENVEVTLADEEDIDIGSPSDLTNNEDFLIYRKIVRKMHGEAIDLANRIEELLARPQAPPGMEENLDFVIIRAAEQPEQVRRVFDDALYLVKQQFILENAAPARKYNIESSLYTSTFANAHKLKDILCACDIPTQSAVTWVHRFFVENLPATYLAAYLSLLRYSKGMFGSHVTTLVKSTESEYPPWSEITSLIKELIKKKAIDPETDDIDDTIDMESMSDTVFLLISPSVSVGEPKTRRRAQESIFRWLRHVGHHESTLIKIQENDSQSVNEIEWLTDFLLNSVIVKVAQIAKKYPNVRIVLVGWNWSSYTALLAANHVHGISAIIALGFQVLCDGFRRGHADDEINLTYCPTLFVVGSDDPDHNDVAMKDLQCSMINPTGLVVVGNGNEDLLLPANVLFRLGVTQKFIFRLILEKIFEFLKLPETRWERTKLVPAELNDVFNVDPLLFKSEKVQEKTHNQQQQLLQQQNSAPAPTLSPAPVGGSGGGRRATVSVIDDSPRLNAQPITKKKRVTDTTPLPSPVCGVDTARLRFDELMKKVQVPDDIPQRRTTTDFQKPIERGDLRDRSLTTPASLTRNTFHAPSAAPQQQQQAPQPSPKGPIDPASISLI